MLNRRYPVVLFAGWSGYVWVTRIANAWAADSDESTAAKVISTVTAVALLAGAVAAIAILVRARARAFDAAEVMVLRLFAGATVAVWAVRVPLILLAEHGVAFKVVHTVLALASVVLAVVTWRVAGSGESTEEPTTVPAVSPAANGPR
jgi:hypothetical protein